MPRQDHVLVFAKDTVEGERLRLCVRCGLISIEPNHDFRGRYYFVPGKSYSPTNPHRLIPIYEMPNCRLPRGDLMAFDRQQQEDNLGQPLETCKFTSGISPELLKILHHNNVRLASDLRGKSITELFEMTDGGKGRPTKKDLQALIEGLKPASLNLDPLNRLESLERIKDARLLPEAMADTKAGPFSCPDCRHFFYLDAVWLRENGTTCRCCYCGKKLNVPYHLEAP